MVFFGRNHYLVRLKKKKCVSLLKASRYILLVSILRLQWYVCLRWCFGRRRSAFDRNLANRQTQGSPRERLSFEALFS